MTNPVSLLPNVSIDLVNQQLKVKPFNSIPQKPLSSLEELSQLKRSDGSIIPLVNEEKAAINLRSVGNFNFPPQLTTQQASKVMEQFKIVGGLFDLNFYKLLKNQICCDASDAAKTHIPNTIMVDKNIAGRVVNLFVLFEIYLSKNEEGPIQLILEQTPVLIHEIKDIILAFPSSQKRDRDIYIQLKNHLQFFNTCLQNRYTCLPFLLIPNRFGIISVKKEQILQFYQCSGKSIIAGLESFVKKFEITKLRMKLGAISTKTKEKNKKWKNQSSSPLSMLQANLNTYEDHLPKSSYAFLKIINELVSKECSEKFVNIVAHKGYAIIKSSTLTIHTMKSDEEIADDSKKLFTLLSEFKDKYHAFLDAERSKRELIEKTPGCKSNPILTNAIQIFICDRFNEYSSFIEDRVHTFLRITDGTLFNINSYDEKKKMEWIKFEPYITRSRQALYGASSSVRDLDCLLHGVIDDIMNIEKQIHQNDKTKADLIVIADAFIKIFVYIRAFSFDHVSNYPVSIPEIMQTITDTCKTILSLIMKLRNTNPEAAATLNNQLSLLGVIDNLIRKNSEIIVREVSRKLVATKFQNQTEIDKQFVGNCLKYSLWFLNRLNDDLFGAAVQYQNASTQLIESLKIIETRIVDNPDISNVKKSMEDFFVEYKEKNDTHFKQYLICLKNFEKLLLECKQLCASTQEKLDYPLMFKWFDLNSQKNNEISSLNNRLIPEIQQLTINLFEKLDTKNKKFKKLIELNRHLKLLENFLTSISTLQGMIIQYLYIFGIAIFNINFTFMSQMFIKEIERELLGRPLSQPSSRRFRSRRHSPPSDNTKNVVPAAAASSHEIDFSTSSCSTVSSSHPTASQTLTTISTVQEMVKNIHPLVRSANEVKAKLAGLKNMHLRSSAGSAESRTVIDCYHHASQILELLERYAAHEDWEVSTLLEFLSKVSLFLELTFKQELQTLNGIDEGQAKIYHSHDLVKLWGLYCQALGQNNSSDVAEFLANFESVASVISRYPLEQVDTTLSSDIIAIVKGKARALQGQSTDGSDQGEHEQQLKNLRQSGIRLCELAFEIWQKKSVDCAPNLEVPSFEVTTNSTVDYAKELHNANTIARLLKFKTMIHMLACQNMIPVPACRKQLFKTSFHLEGALTNLFELLNEVDILSIPYAASNAILLQVSTILEQAALGVIANMDIKNPENPEQHILEKKETGNTERLWRYTHNITKFVQEISKKDDESGILIEDATLIDELTEFLSFSHHYPAQGSRKLAQDLDNIRKWSVLKQEILACDGFLPEVSGKWCKSQLGDNPKTWVDKIDVQIELEFREKILRRVMQALEVACELLSKM